MAKNSKVYVPFSLSDAEKFLYSEGDAPDVVDVMDDAQKLIYAETIRLHRRIDEIENQAAEMMGPEAMTEMANKFLGVGG